MVVSPLQDTYWEIARIFQTWGRGGECSDKFLHLLNKSKVSYVAILLSVLDCAGIQAMRRTDK